MTFYSEAQRAAAANVLQRLQESDRFFMNEGRVQTTLRRLAKRLTDEDISYAVIGGMALFLHGYVRETLDVDLILTPESLKVFRDRFVGRGYLPAFEGALKRFRDTASGVAIEILTTGDYAGARPGPVVFPDPQTASVEREGVRVITLEKLIELKLASGLNAPHRLRDLADVQDLIINLKLPLDLTEMLDPSVRAEYRRLWELAQHAAEGPHEREP